ncbi:peptidylglycine monooxygenase-like protein [Prosthecobacter algae]|uniref:Peptidylglycine monooxygenase-like protein n=1 Tax=Prosthecobacter algae TaxID=1144682 RepID=A0ABP9PHI4_9BACT
MKRRTLLAAASTAFAAPFVRSQSKTSLQGSTIGHGQHRYQVDLEWCKAQREQHPVKDCHEMVMDAQKRLIMITNEARNNILIFDKEGQVLDAWTLKLNGGHGLTLDSRDGKECLWLCDPSGGAVIKTTLKGEVLMKLPHAKDCGAYDAISKYAPTEAAIAPNGDIYVADGYGSQFILHFDSRGKFIRKFGGLSTQAMNAGKFMQAHGVAIDSRGPTPLVLCTERVRNEFHWYTLDGQYVRSVYLPGAFMSRPVIAGDLLLSGVCFGMKPGDYRMWRERGFIVILDKDNRVISAPGGQPPEYAGDQVKLLLQDQPVFRNVHDVCMDDEGSLYACQWNADKAYPYKLRKV